ncbi:MAG: inner nuclear membrane protein enriched at telomere/subtelomere region [Bathelium mastoideum]|nr:MAG: inner nuclear membrane protein enriched at telomere/subtelomere region [Bathelium mastoideum]KAI9688827.1 MAG: inner nuclear membrane protein enriched at telomere/subtelomere region [Bathelium mastoideum]
MADDMDYLAQDFDPATLTVPRLRSILVAHNVNYPSSAKKPQLIEIFNENVAPQARKLLREQSRIKRSSKGIEDVPSSQASTVDEEEDRRRMRPPPVPDTPRRASRRRTTPGNVDGSTDEEPVARTSVGRTPGRPARRTSKKAGRPVEDDSGVDMAQENLAPPKRTRKSISPAIKQDEPEPQTWRKTDADDSPFTQDNPFQSGSSPAEPEPRAVSGERRRKTLESGETREIRRISKPMRRSEAAPSRRGNRAVVDSSSKTVEMPVARIKREEVEEPSAGEEFTADEQQDLAVARANNNNKDVLPARRRPGPSSASSSVLKLATTLVSFAAFSGFAFMWRQEKIEVGYCGVGRAPATEIRGIDIPDWASFLQPQCEPCPPHAFCSHDLGTTCENDFILQSHPLSLGGLVPLPPSCEPDGEKAKRVQLVIDRAVQELRERNAKFECGELVDEETGKHASSPELDATQLKSEVSSMKKKAMNQEEFEDLWRSALPEIMSRDEIVVRSDGPNHPPFLHSASTAALPLTCALRRSLRLALARHLRSALTALALFLAAASAWARLRAARADEARARVLAAAALQQLARQAAYAKYGGEDGREGAEGEEAYISVAQLRDDVLQAEFSAARRKKVWERVAAKVEGNANVRPMVREGRNGDVSRVWEWVGAVGALEDGGVASRRRESGRLSLGFRESPSLMVERGEDSSTVELPERGRAKGPVKWEDEGRPIY